MATDGPVYLCIKQFNARLGDELSLKVGDKVEVLADDSEYNDGWYMGKNLLTSDVGLYPKSFTQKLQENNPQKTLLRSRSRRVISNPSSQPTTPINKVNKLADQIEKFNILDKDDNKVKTTMNDIDKALHELQSESFLDTTTSTAMNSNDFSEEVLEKSLDSNKGHVRNESSQSLTEDLNPLKAAEWTPQQVSSYFAIVLGFDMEVAGKFARHKITGAILFELDLSHLKELDIASFGTRFEVHKEIEKLKQISSRGAKHRTSRAGTIKKLDTPNNKLQISIPEISKEDEFVSPPGSKVASPNKMFSFQNNSDDDPSLSSSLQNDSSTQGLLMPSAQLNQLTRNGTIYQRGHLRKRSQSLENIAGSDKRNSMTPEGLFSSPRRPPVPPSSTTPINTNFKFGEPELSGLYVTRTNASQAALSRPSSSIYESSMVSHNRNVSQNSNHHRRNSSAISTHHRRHSSLFLFLSGNDDKTLGQKPSNNKLQSTNIYKENGDSEGTDDLFQSLDNTPKLTSPAKVRRKSSLFSPNQKSPDLDHPEDELDIDNANFSPKKSKSISYKQTEKMDRDEKRSASDSAGPVSRLKNLRTTSTQNFRNLTSSKKLKTSAFQEGIREINPDEAIKSSNFSGWMSKRSGNTLSWRSRYFTLHGTRLSYFTSLKDKKEKGLIDITAHKVIPINTDTDANAPGSNDKYIALYASSTGFGRYCFKVVPPAPGFKKGLTFTQPKTHYFAVDTQEEMRGWMKALMTATIDIDDSVPVVSSCSTPTVSLAKAQELLSKAREETRLKDEESRTKSYMREYEEYGNSVNEFGADLQTSVESGASPNIDETDDTTVSSKALPKLKIDTNSSNKAYTKTPSTPQISTNSSQGGFASPYLLASGLLSPKLGHSGMGSSTASTPTSSQNKSSADYFHDNHTESSSAGTETTPKSVFSNSNGRIMSGSRKISYSNDGSGNHNFVIKSKK
jgi:hypothetical protein